MSRLSNIRNSATHDGFHHQCYNFFICTRLFGEGASHEHTDAPVNGANGATHEKSQSCIKVIDEQTNCELRVHRVGSYFLNRQQLLPHKNKKRSTISEKSKNTRLDCWDNKRFEICANNFFISCMQEGGASTTHTIPQRHLSLRPWTKPGAPPYPVSQ